MSKSERRNKLFVYIFAIGITGLHFTSRVSSLQFGSKPSYVEFPENTTIGTSLFNLTATDYGTDSHMTISAADERTQLYVKITQEMENNILLANIILKQSLDREEFVTGMELKFFLSDGKGNTVTTSVRLYILDICDAAPQFDRPSYTLEIEENVTTGIIAFPEPIHATDNDNGIYAVVTYTMEPNTKSDYWKTIYKETFAIDRSTGALKLLKTLDYENNSFYQFTLHAVDSCNLTAKPVSLAIRVKDIQDKPPFFIGLPYMRTIPEGNYTENHVLKVEAFDGDFDIPNKINYSLNTHCAINDTKCNFCSGLFTINSSTGDITVAGNIDWDMKNVSDIYGTCTIEVEATEISNLSNNGDATSKTNVTVTIQDINNHAPEFSSTTYSASVQENANQNTTILLDGSATGIEVSDKDQGMNSRFHLALRCENETICETFAVEPSDIIGKGILAIRVNDSSLLDFEVRQNITVRVIATEGTNNTHINTATIFIKIQNVNEFSPTFVDVPYEASIMENSPNGTLVKTITATDKDKELFGKVSYSLPGANNNLFSVNNETGQVRTNCDPSQLDREKISIFYLTIIAMDGGGRINQTQIIVNLTDVNDNQPVFVQDVYNAFLEENSTTYMNKTLLTVKATDADQNSKISYTFGNNNWNSNFTINNASGEIMIRSELDYEALDGTLNGVINLTVYAIDNGMEHTGNVTVTITVQDVNDNGPLFSDKIYYASIKENATCDTFVAKVNATDADKTERNKKFSFAIEAGGFDNFRINSTTGNVMVQVGAHFDRDSINLYNLTIIAIDQGTNAYTANATLSVTITDVNNKPPNFNQTIYSIVVPENVSIGYSFNCCIAKDPDTDHHLRYSIKQTKEGDENERNVNQSAREPYIQIHENNGTLYVNSNLDREMVQTLELTIVVTDVLAVENIPQIATATVAITVLDSDDNPPKFTLERDFRLGMRRNMASGTTIFELKSYVTDKDKPENGANKWTFQNVSFEISPTELKNELYDKPKSPLCSHPICVIRNGTIVNNMYYTQDMSGYFNVNISVNDDAGYDTTNILIFLIADSQVLKMTILGIRTNVATYKDAILRDCSNVTGLLFVYDSIADYKADDGKVDTSKTDLFFHIQDHKHNRVLSAEEAKRLLDEYAEKLYIARTQYQIASIDSSLKSGNTVDTSSKTIYIMTAVIALLGLVILIVGYMFFSSSNRYKRKLRAVMPPEKEINNKKKDEFITPGSNMYAYKENPLLHTSYAPPMYQEIDAKSTNSLDTNEVDEAKLSTKGEEEEKEVTLDIYGEDYYISEPTEDPLEAALREHDNQKHASISKLRDSSDGDRENDDKKQTFTGFINKAFNDDLNLETSEI